MVPVIEARGVMKRFGATRALDGLDLVARPGEVFALLGPNGSGKTTFVRSLATLLEIDGGVLRVAGIDVTREPRAVRQVIGLAGQYAAVEGAMTGRENLEMVARLFGLDRAQAKRNATAVLEQIDLADVADRLVRTYSGGMARRLDLGASLVGAPRLLLLDEPTTGLDPRSRADLWDAIRNLVANGTDVLLTTQYLEEADQLAEHIVIIDRGRAIAEGTSRELKGLAGRDVVSIHARSGADLPALARLLDPLGAEAVRIDEPTRTLDVPVDGGAEKLAAAVRLLETSGIEIDDLALRRPTLDEVFLHLTGESTASDSRDDGVDR